jgi:hypothetical protein
MQERVLTGTDRITLAAEPVELGVAESAVSAISWAAIAGGAAAALGASLVLMTAAAGLGLTTVSPWDGWSEAATTFTFSAAIGFIIVQWLASAFGGYVAGRLRTKWANMHADEVFFRDTAHGFLAWALATLIAVFLAVATTTSIVGGVMRGATGIAQGAATGAAQGATANGTGSSGLGDYLVDKALRPAATTSATLAPRADQNASAEIASILVHDLAAGDVSAENRTYLAQLISARTGLSQADAEKRVDELVTQAKAVKAQAIDTADKARKAAAMFALFSALALLIGAFVASAAGALGGRSRDA